jgi:hypothetical protein
LWRKAAFGLPFFKQRLGLGTSNWRYVGRPFPPRDRHTEFSFQRELPHTNEAADGDKCLARRCDPARGRHLATDPDQGRLPATLPLAAEHHFQNIGTEAVKFASPAVELANDRR